MSLRLESVSFGYRRGRAQVFDDFSWQVPPGRSVLLGPNGAGKSTLLALLAGVLTPRRGRVLAGDGDEADSGRSRRDVRRSVGWMPQSIVPVPGLTLVEQVAYAGWLKGMGRREAAAAALEALAVVDLDGARDEKVHRVSGGQRRRLGLAQTLVSRPQVLLLDEPTAGLDPSQRARFREILLRVEPGVSVVVSTHQVDDLDQIFHTTTVLSGGRVQFEGSTAAFLAVAGDAGGHRNPAEAAYAKVLPAAAEA